MNDETQKKRLKVLKYALFVVAGVILVRLFMIQIIQKEEWVAKAEAQHTFENTIKAKRGEIYMMDGSEPVAVVMNEKAWTVILDPMVAEEKELADAVFTEEMKPYLTVDSATEVLKDRTRRYFVVAKNVPRKLALELREKEVTGMIMQEGTKRVYPEGTLAARLLGFVNMDGDGQYGVEGSLDEELKGKDGRLKTIADVNNVALSIGKDNIRVPAEDGKNVVLTVDRNVQAKVEEILQRRMTEFGKDQASALVMDPRTGEILAMANLPGYDPGNYGEVEDASVYVNRVTDDPYEPASVCKSFTFATGIELGVLDANTMFYNNGYEVIDGWQIKNSTYGQANLLGPTSIQNALNWSLNTGSIHALKLIGGDATQINEQGRKTLYDFYVNHFGLGKETGIELYEATGLINDPVEGDGRDSLYANMTFGQNMLVTMLQVASGYSALVNGGEYHHPTIVKGYMEGGVLVEKERAGAAWRAVSEDTSRQMREMLWGTRSLMRATGVDRDGYFVGGKTGTAQVIRDGAYSMDEWVATYVGFGGATGEMPEYLAMVRIWKDGETTGAEQYAQPVFNDISDFMIDYLKIKPGA
ncbi:penicillin-binding protein 2 [Candidatus Saccharibacteria bacterium]|nr:penicillin-binding protein 2 [Candidatus Saccharibacteria bacterium]